MGSVHGSLRTAERNLAKYEDARRVLAGIEKSVSPWLAVPDEDLPGMVPPPEVPRAFNSSFEGCPIHGMELFKFGNYSWIMHPFRRPWKLKCPVGGEEYPSNDFQAYLESGMADRCLLTGPYADDGWGWRRQGDVKKHWFVAYYCHWYWYNHIIPGVLGLSRAYLLTRKDVYGRKCLLLLHRIAEHYPAMDHNKQSRYAQEFSPSYTGKIVNMIWETNVIRDLAESMANIRGYLRGDASDLVGKGPGELVDFLEERILMEGLRGMREGRIVGNYGMHQLSAVIILKALGREEVTREWLEFLLSNPAGGYHHQGISYAMDNFIYRDGVSFENAPGYCHTWSRNLLRVATHLSSMGAEFPDLGKLRSMLEASGRMVCLGRYTPAIGDSGSVASGKIELASDDAVRAYRMFGAPEFARLAKAGFQSYEDLFVSPLSEAKLRASSLKGPRLSSECLSGYGLVILRARGLECSMFFGRRNGHGHHDRLGIELFGCGERLTPDLGYPQFASETKAPPAWERNTIAHNTVTVNERKQDLGCAGWLRMFHSRGFVEAAEAEANRTYDDAGLYMRTICLIDRQRPFFLDIFRVVGGNAHDYSMHGKAGAFATGGLALTARKGTLAGPDVPFGYLYDDPELERPGKDRSFYSYKGSGFSYLYDLEVGTPRKTWWADWRSDSSAVRFHFPHPGQEVAVASGNPPLRPGNPRSLKYVILRNRGKDLRSTFTAVGEGYREVPMIRSVKPLSTTSDGEGLPVGIEVRRGDRRYIVLSSTDPGCRIKCGSGSAEFRGRLVVVETDAAGSPVEIFIDGSLLAYPSVRIETGCSPLGTIREVKTGDWIRIAIDEPIDPGSCVGEFAFISNERRSSSFRILGARSGAEGLELRLEHSGRMGRLRGKRAGDCEVVSETELLFTGYRYYEGARLVDRERRRWIMIEEAEGRNIRLSEPLGEFDASEAYVYEFGPGDRVSIAPYVTVRRTAKGWSGSTNLQATLTIEGRTRKVGPGRFGFRRS